LEHITLCDGVVADQEMSSVDEVEQRCRDWCDRWAASTDRPLTEVVFLAVLALGSLCG